MAKGYPQNQNFSRGLQTKAVEDGQPLPDFQTFANVRVSDGSASARKGMVRVARGSSVIEALDFVAASSMCYTSATSKLKCCPGDLGPCLFCLCQGGRAGHGGGCAFGRGPQTKPAPGWGRGGSLLVGGGFY